MKNFIGAFFPRSRKLDPTTSHQAAQQIKEIAPNHMQKIHDCLHEHGPMGKDQIALILHMNPNQVSRRLPEMEKMKLVSPTGKTVESLSGRQEREWMGL